MKDIEDERRCLKPPAIQRREHSYRRPAVLSIPIKASKMCLYLSPEPQGETFVAQDIVSMLISEKLHLRDLQNVSSVLAILKTRLRTSAAPGQASFNKAVVHSWFVFVHSSVGGKHYECAG